MMIGLGVGIDYALFILARHRQNLESGMPVPEAIGRANATAGLSVLFAGITVVLAIAGLQVSGIPMMTMMGWASAIMVAITMLAAVTLLPALLGIAGQAGQQPAGAVHQAEAGLQPAVEVGPLGGQGRRQAGALRRGRRGRARGAGDPGRSSMQLGFPDAGNDGTDTTTRKAYDLMADKYGPGVNGPLSVVVETNGSPDAAAVIADLTQGHRCRQGRRLGRRSPSSREKKDLAIISVTPTTAPQDAETSDLLERLRDGRRPRSRRRQRRSRSSVTGCTAMVEDISSRLQQRMP